MKKIIKKTKIFLKTCKIFALSIVLEAKEVKKPALAEANTQTLITKNKILVNKTPDRVKKRDSPHR